jgi:hypothetical protein
MRKVVRDLFFQNWWRWILQIWIAAFTLIMEFFFVLLFLLDLFLCLFFLVLSLVATVLR